MASTYTENAGGEGCLFVKESGEETEVTEGRRRRFREGTGIINHRETEERRRPEESPFLRFAVVDDFPVPSVLSVISG
jgi:hypothetical protein